MSEDQNLIELVEKEVMAFSEVSRFADASLTENITQAVLRKDSNPSIRIQNDDDKYTIGIETDISWYVPISKKALKGLRFGTEQKNGYIKIDKETMAMTAISEEEFEVIKERQEALQK